MGPELIGAAVSGISGLIKGIAGIKQKKEGKKLLAGLQYPTETLPEEYQKNENLAEQMAASGMPSEQYNQAMRNIQRQQLTALRYSKDRRNSLAVLPQILQSTNDATLNLDAADASQRLANQRNLLGVRGQTAAVKRDLFDKNVRSKYNRDYNYGMSLVGMGNQNLFSGIDSFATGGLAALGSLGGGKGSAGGGAYAG